MILTVDLLWTFASLKHGPCLTADEYENMNMERHKRVEVDTGPLREKFR